MKNLMLLILVSLVPALINAVEPEQANNKFVAELATCSAFYSLMAAEAERQGRTIPELSKSAEYAFLLGVDLSAEHDDTLQQIELALTDMRAELGVDAANSKVLVQKYLGACGAILQDPESRMEYWLGRR